MKLIDYFKIIIHCFYSKKLYRYIYTSWSGNIFAYYFILSLVICLPICLEKIIFFSKIEVDKLTTTEELTGINEEIRLLIQQIPTITIDNFEMKTSDGAVHKVLSSSRNVVIVFDPEQKIIGNLDKEHHPETINIGKYGIFMRGPSVDNGTFVEYNMLPLANQNTLEINKNIIIDMLVNLKSNIVPYSFFYSLIVSLLIVTSSLFFALIYSVIIKLVYLVSNVRPNYKNLYVLIAISQTPAILIKGLFNISILYDVFLVLSFLPLVLGVMYLLFSLKAIKENIGPS